MKWVRKQDWRKEIPTDRQKNRKTDRQTEKKTDRQKLYMVSDSLCLTCFINVEFKVSLVVSGQRPHRVTTEKMDLRGSMEGLWGG